MKIDFVLTAVNNNSYYYNLYPYVSKVWKERFNLDLICIFIGEEIPQILEKYKENIILFKPIENINPIYIAQLIRILYPALFENKNILITDMDIIPISKYYFLEHLKNINEDYFITYTDRYIKQKMYAICYNVANSNIWKKIFNINSINDIKNFLIKYYNKNYDGRKNCDGWYSDQKLLYKYLQNYEKLIILNDKQLNYKRLDGKGSIKLKYILDNIDNIVNNIEDYSDFHILRNYHKYLYIINKIIDKIIDNLNKKNIYILCDKNIFNIFQDYYLSISQYLNNKLILYTSFNEIEIYLNNENNILLFLRILPFNILEKINNYKSKIYFINTEQTTVQKRIEFIKEYFKYNIKILDYSKENLYILNNKYKYKNTLYLPYIYNPKEIYNLEKIKDVCIIAPNGYRKNIINIIKKDYNIDVDIINGWNEERDLKLFQYKILINISAYRDYKIFELIRCYRCLFNKMIIISDEKYNKNLIDYNEHILFTNKYNIPNLLNDVLNNYNTYYQKLNIDNVNKKYFDEHIYDFNSKL
jgi:hypothetical protein